MPSNKNNQDSLARAYGGAADGKQMPGWGRTLAESRRERVELTRKRLERRADAAPPLTAAERDALLERVERMEKMHGGRFTGATSALRMSVGYSDSANEARGRLDSDDDEYERDDIEERAARRDTALRRLEERETRASERRANYND